MSLKILVSHNKHQQSVATLNKYINITWHYVGSLLGSFMLYL